MTNRAIFAGAFTLLLGVANTSSAQTGTCSAATASLFLDIANVRARIVNNGNLFWRGDPYVYEVPKGGGASALFTGGLWFGGFLDTDLRVTAARYGDYEFWAGPLDESGNPPPDCFEFNRIWRINQSDIDNVDAGGAPAVDLEEWPTGLGAPTLTPAEDDGIDNDRDSSTDEPGEMRSITEEVLALPLSQRIDRVIDLELGERPDMIGDQMLWWIMNDRGNTHESTGSSPIGLEVHGQAFAVNLPGHIANATFYRYVVFYRGTAPLTDAYFGVFVDPDLGDFQDDYVGSDSVGQYGYVYNADNDDQGGYGPNPPAVAVGMLQTPVTPSPGDTAWVSGMRVPDFRNVGMTSFVTYTDGGAANGTPSSKSDYHQFMRGVWKTGAPIRVGGDGLNVDPGAPVTRFMYQGDPVTAEFWSEPNVDGQNSASVPSDRKWVQSSGPITLNPGDRQELAFGIAWGRGDSNLDSIVEMRDAIAAVRGYFESLFPVINVSVEEADFADDNGIALHEPHPNPASGEVRITFTSSEQLHVRVDVLDALGRRVALVYDAAASAGGHSIEYDTSGLPSGIYFVRLTSDSSHHVASLVVTH